MTRESSPVPTTEAGRQTVLAELDRTVWHCRALGQASLADALIEWRRVLERTFDAIPAQPSDSDAAG